MSRVNGWPPKAEILQRVQVSAAHEFLVRRGWEQKPSPRRTSHYFVHPVLRYDSGEPFHYYFPASDHFADYPMRVLDFIENWARYYELDPVAVLAELQGGPIAQPGEATVSA